MNNKLLHRCLYFIYTICLIFIFENMACATVSDSQSIPNPINFESDQGEHPSAAKEIWMFSGTVKTEDAQKYAYMYTIKRKKNPINLQNEWQVFVNVIDLAAQREVLLYKYVESNPDIKIFQGTEHDHNIMTWHIGKAFLKYNMISDSWLFGVLDDKNGFNFRVKSIRNYVLNGKNGYLKWEDNNNFQVSYSAQNMQINGHLTLNTTNTFVAGENSWFEHRWGTTKTRHQMGKYALITCRFGDNTGLMLYEWLGKKNQWLKPLKTGTYQDALNQKKILSNFYLSRSAKTQRWTISVPALNLHIAGLGDNISEYDVIKVKAPKNGYCFVNQKGF